LDTDNDTNFDEARVDEIIEEVFQNSDFHRPNNVEFTFLQDPRQKAIVDIYEDTLLVEAGSEPVLRRALGRYLIKQSWPTIDWLLATRLGTFAALSLLLMIAIPSIALLMLHLMPDLATVITYSVVILDTCIGIWLSYLISNHHATFRSRLAERMSDLGCITEFDGTDYNVKSNDTFVFPMLILVLSLIVMISFVSYATPDDLFILFVPLFPMLFAVIGLHRKMGGPYGDDPCLWSEEEDEYGPESPTIRQGLMEVIERAELREAIQEKHEPFDDILVLFRKSPGPQYRMFHDFVEDSILHVQACDLSEEACLRLGAATFAQSSLSFFRDFSFRQRAMHLWAFLFGLIMAFAILLIGIFYGMIAGILSTIFTSIVFSWFWYKGYLLYEQVRAELPKALQKTGVFSRFQIPFYAHYMHSTTRSGDYKLLGGFHLILLFLLLLVFIWS